MFNITPRRKEGNGSLSRMRDEFGDLFDRCAYSFLTSSTSRNLSSQSFSRLAATSRLAGSNVVDNIRSVMWSPP